MTDPSIAALLTPPRVAELGPGSPNEVVRENLRTFEFTQTVRDPLAARACLAGLWLYHDFLDESHAISQDLDTKESSCWHARSPFIATANSATVSIRLCTFPCTFVAGQYHAVKPRLATRRPNQTRRGVSRLSPASGNCPGVWKCARRFHLRMP